MLAHTHAPMHAHIHAGTHTRTTHPALTHSIEDVHDLLVRLAKETRRVEDVETTRLWVVEGQEARKRARVAAVPVGGVVAVPPLLAAPGGGQEEHCPGHLVVAPHVRSPERLLHAAEVGSARTRTKDKHVAPLRCREPGFLGLDFQVVVLQEDLAGQGAVGLGHVAQVGGSSLLACLGAPAHGDRVQARQLGGSHVA